MYERTFSDTISLITPNLLLMGPNLALEFSEVRCSRIQYSAVQNCVHSQGLFHEGDQLYTDFATLAKNYKEQPRYGRLHISLCRVHQLAVCSEQRRVCC